MEPALQLSYKIQILPTYKTAWGSLGHFPRSAVFLSLRFPLSLHGVGRGKEGGREEGEEREKEVNLIFLDVYKRSVVCQL